MGTSRTRGERAQVVRIAEHPVFGAFAPARLLRTRVREVWEDVVGRAAWREGGVPRTDADVHALHVDLIVAHPRVPPPAQQAVLAEEVLGELDCLSRRSLSFASKARS